MKHNLIRIFVLGLLISSLNFSSYGQSVIQESAQMTAEQKRVQTVKQEIRKLQTDYAKADEQFSAVESKLRPYEVVLNPTREKLDKKLQDIEQTQYEMQKLNLKQTCNQIYTLQKSIGVNSNSSCLEGKIKRLDEKHKEIRNQIAGLQKKQGEEATSKIEHENDLSNLDKEISSLDAMLANSKAPTTKSKSLDDFLTEKGKTKTKSSKSLDDMLSSSNNKKTTKSKSLDDMLSSSNAKNATKSKSLDAMLGSSSKNSKSNSLDNLISEASDDTDFTIDSKNGLAGVINSQGKVLIPYNDWEIVEYKMGIAKVRKKGETISCSGTYTAYKEGFVDNKGEFIDGFEVTFSNQGNSSYKPLTIYMNTGKTAAEKEANDRYYERRIEREKKEKEIKRKQCEIEINNWKRSIIAKYK